MKKVALSLIALLAAGGFAAADDVATGTTVPSPVTASIALSASTTFGYDLDTGRHGFVAPSAGDASVTLWFTNGANTKTGAGDVHGFITADTVKLGLDGAADTANPVLTIADITAKVVFPNGYLKVYGNTDPAQDYGHDVDNDNGGVTTTGDDLFYTYSGVYGATSAEFALSSLTSFGGLTANGVEVQYALPKLATVTAQIGSDKSYKAASDAAYEGAVEVALTAVDKLTLAGKVVYNADLTAAGAKVGYDLGKLAPYADVNYSVTDSTYDADFGVVAPLADGLKVDAVAQYDSDAKVNSIITLSLAQGKLIGPLSLDVGAQIVDATNADKGATSIFGKVAFRATETIGLWAKASGNNVADSKTATYVKFGCDFTGISLTTISVNYDSSDLGSANLDGDSKLGAISTTVKVAY